MNIFGVEQFLKTSENSGEKYTLTQIAKNSIGN